MAVFVDAMVSKPFGGSCVCVLKILSYKNVFFAHHKVTSRPGSNQSRRLSRIPKLIGWSFIDKKNRLSTDFSTFKQILIERKEKYATFTTRIAH